MRSASRKMKAGRIKRKKREGMMRYFATKLEGVRKNKEMMSGIERK